MSTLPADDVMHEALRRLPSVDHLLNQPPIASLLNDHPRGELLLVIRAVLDGYRTALRAGQVATVDVPSLALAIRQQLYERARPSLRRVINATGVVLHTGLGRAPLADEAIAAIADAAAGYCNLEYRLETGERGNRHDHVRGLLRELTGAEDALVVNNNAAATYLALRALAAGRDVIISRGQLVEIGGSYRLPDIMAAAQCHMIEVGTTNRTRISDYEAAVAANTAALLRVHTSNYRVVGFTEAATLAELVTLARRHNLLVIDDLGSGLLWGANNGEQSPPYGGDEPTVAASVAAGADVALFSGDKLLGGPQAGIIVGRTDLIARLEKDPLARTFRPDKLTLAALEATLRLYRDPQTAVHRIPALRYLARNEQELRATAESLAQAITAALPDAVVTTRADVSEAGGGALAAVPFPTWVVEVRPRGVRAACVVEGLRKRELPVLCRLQAEALVFDPRTLDGDDVAQIPGALAEVIQEVASSE
jgi:L-seryl-tRNA(Ser) seleniumtransferase